MATGNDVNNPPVSPSSSLDISDWGTGIVTDKKQQERFAGFHLDVKNTGVKELLRFNIEMGVLVILGTHPSTSLTGSLRAATTGTPTGHAVAVLGPTEILTGKQGQNLEDGVLIYDPYGIALDGERELSDDSTVVRFSRMTDLSEKDTSPKTPEAEEEISFISGSVPESSVKALALLRKPDEFESVEPNDVGLLTKTAGHSVRFYAYEQLHRYFAKGTIAAGGLFHALADQE